MWIRSENGDTIKPSAVIRSGNRVIINRNFHRVEATEEVPEHWEYETWDMSEEQYEVYLAMEASMREQDDALIELAGLVAEVLG